MNSEKLAAHSENRIYYFYITQQKAYDFTISMYNTPYTFILQDGIWQNHSSNSFAMAEHLVDAVVATVLGKRE